MTYLWRIDIACQHMKIKQTQQRPYSATIHNQNKHQAQTSSIPFCHLNHFIQQTSHQPSANMYIPTAQSVLTAGLAMTGMLTERESPP